MGQARSLPTNRLLSSLRSKPTVPSPSSTLNSPYELDLPSDILSLSPPTLLIILPITVIPRPAAPCLHAAVFSEVESRGQSPFRVSTMYLPFLPLDWEKIRSFMPHPDEEMCYCVFPLLPFCIPSLRRTPASSVTCRGRFCSP